MNNVHKLRQIDPTFTMSEGVTVAIIMAVAQVVAAALALFGKAKSSQPKATPDANQPYARTAGKWAYLMKMSIWPLAGIASAVGLLVWEFTRPGPVTKLSLLFIVLGSVGLSVHASLLFLLPVADLLTRRTDDLMELVGLLIDLSKQGAHIGTQTTEIQRKIVEVLASVGQKPAKKRRTPKGEKN